MQSRVGAVARLLFIDLLGSVAWFPVWWYTKGLMKVVNASWGALHYRVQSYGFRIWIRNFFVPMYGQYDITGKLVSVVMRFFVLIARAIALVVEAIVYFVGIVAWGLAPALFLLMAFTSVVRGVSGLV
ncbi:MAG: hypothetical protein WC787_04835 [Patescibacteria group bacterium]|jgi:hypothetical protein